MPRISNLFDIPRRESLESNMEPPNHCHYSSTAIPQSPRSVSSSVSASPAASLFSSRAHSRFPSSVSSLGSSPGVTGSTEAFGTMKTQLAEVKEEPVESEGTLVEEDNYFPHFNDFHAVDNTEGKAWSSLESHEYDLSDGFSQPSASPKKRRADNIPFRGFSRISTRLSSMSSRWRQKQLSDTAAALERYDESLRSRANSATSTLVSPVVSSLSRRESGHARSPARAAFEERISEAGIAPLDIEKANAQSPPEGERHATTPLLPPMMKDLPNPVDEVPLNSPLQSPSVTRAPDSPSVSMTTTVSPVSGLPSPPISTQPSLSSIRPPQMGSTRGCSMDIPSMNMEEPVDEWAQKLGHANFTILPEPYEPTLCTIEAFEEHRACWELARCNFAKHLVRTGEHYGITSNIYRLTEEKWESINEQWRQTHNRLAANLADKEGNPLSLSKSNIHTGEAIKLPRLHDKEKFPDLGDEDIIGPMSVARQSPPSSQQRSRKRSFFRFLQDLFG
ncbi:hypothetical protein VTO42DRAFT_2723 [Malbranchea cinnamomea]